MEKKDERRINSDKLEFLKLLGKNMYNIPEDFLNLVLQAHPDWKANRVINVRWGRTHDLSMLKEIIHITVNKPGNLKPTEKL